MFKKVLCCLRQGLADAELTEHHVNGLFHCLKDFLYLLFIFHKKLLACMKIFITVNDNWMGANKVLRILPCPTLLHGLSAEYLGIFGYSGKHFGNYRNCQIYRKCLTSGISKLPKASISGYFGKYKFCQNCRHVAANAGIAEKS